jgi:hypothetical protein
MASMSSRSKKYMISLRVALLLLLLSMQSFSLAHELNHGVTHDADACLSCSVRSANEGAVTSSYVAAPLSAEHPVLERHYISITYLSPHYFQEVRGPPTSL